MGRLFGTDGVRGLANADLTADLALQLAASAGRVLAEARGVQGRPVAVVARDTRASGEFLEAAVVAGLASAGIDVLLVGVVPTPAAAFLTDHLDADLGVMLSASHNPMPDNGIKFFARGGVKLDDAIEDRIEADLQGQLSHARPTGADVGRVRLAHDAWQAYSEHLLGTIRHRLTGLRVVLDCANGAASAIGPGILTAAGAEVIALHAEPDGLNINVDCGSTHLDSLITAVREHGYDLGIALDGDADRCLAVDHTGAVVDGDHVLALLGLALREQGALAHETIVGTVMANLGFINAMREQGIDVVQTQVGDRYVLESMREFGYRLGGEPSGHVILADHASTGDGLLTALHIMDRMAQTGKSLQELASIVTKYPQVLINVGGVDRAGLAQNANVAQAVAQAEKALGESGRVLLRPSGTEPLVRVMVEAASQEQAVRVAEELAAVVAAELTDQSA